MTNTITKERRDAVRAAALAATPSPWRSDRTGLYVWAASAKLKDDTFPLADGGGNDAVIARMRGWGYYTGKGGGALALSSDEAVAAIRRDLDHIANCDPQTILALLDALDAAEAKMGEPVAVRFPYSRIIEIVNDCSERMKAAGESHRMLAKWVSEGINAELHRLYAAPPAAEPVKVTEAMIEAASRVMANALYEGSEAWGEYYGVAKQALSAAMLVAAPSLVSEKEAE